MTLLAMVAPASPAALPVSEAASERHTDRPAGSMVCSKCTAREGIACPRMTSLVRGDDGRRRCWWGASTPDYVAYHDEEWGRPVRDDRGIYERMVLEGFQSGLSWLTILRKRESFRAAFAGFEIEAVAALRRARRGAAPRRRRHRSPPRQDRGRDRQREGGRGARPRRWRSSSGPSLPRAAARAPRTLDDLPAVTPESTALAKELKRSGFRFVGPTTAYAAMQACGLVNDHLVGCCVRAAVERERAT